MVKRKPKAKGLGMMFGAVPPPAPPAIVPIPDPFEHLYPPNLSPAERAQWREERLMRGYREIARKFPELGNPSELSPAERWGRLNELKARYEQERSENEQIGAKVRKGAQKGAVARSAAVTEFITARNAEMLREYLEAQPKARLKASPLMEQIGKRYRLGRSQAIAILTAALKEIVRRPPGSDD
jgi:hypothetical protein